MKKLMALLLALCLMFPGAGVVTARASVLDRLPPVFGTGEETIPACDPLAEEGDTASRAYSALMAALAARLREYDGVGKIWQVSLDVPFEVPQEDAASYFDTVLLHTVREYPEFYWVDLGRRWNGYDPETARVEYTVYVLPEFTGGRLEAAQRALDQAFEEAVAQIFRPGMSEAEKVLAAYGWMKQYIRYDNQMGWDAYSAYSGLVKRSAVCHGCAVTLGMLLKEAGVECYTVLSHVEGQDMYHIWCAVKIGGLWYNIDPTASHVLGYQDYGKFLKSSGEMLSGGSYVEDVTRLHLTCDQSYPGDTPWKTTMMSFLYSDKYNGLVNVENLVEIDGTVYLDDTARYRVVTIDEAGKAESHVIATIPACVNNATQEFEDHIYYLTYEGALRSFQVSTGQDQEYGGNYKGLYLNLDEQNRTLLIVDGEGNTRQVLSIPY